MKHILLLFSIFCISCTAASAQHNGSWGIYSCLQIAQTKYAGVHGSIDVYWHQKHSIGISLAWITRDANNIPADYDEHQRPSLISFGSNGPVPDGFYIWTLSYGRYVPIDRAGKLRLHLKLGLSAGTYEGLDNFKLVDHPASGGWFGSSAYSAYEYDNVTRNLYGITLNPAIEYAPARGFGFTIGTLACINNRRFCMAADFGILFGRLRGRKHKVPAADSGK